MAPVQLGVVLGRILFRVRYAALFVHKFRREARATSKVCKRKYIFFTPLLDLRRARVTTFFSSW
jgi:hypothetical protein